MRKALVAAGVALIVAAAFVVPMPLVVLEPAPTLPIAAHLSVEGGEPLNGKTLLTAVRLDDPSLAEAIVAWTADDEELTFERALVPEGVDEEEFFRLQRRLFVESVRSAAAVGMQAAGLPVTVGGDGARVVAVAEDAPAEGELKPGDVITHIDGERVELASSLAAATTTAEPGATVMLQVVRGDETFTTEVELERINELDRAGLGVLVSTLNQRIDLPREVDIEAAEVGGPSGGLMLAVTVFDLVNDRDLIAGRVVAGTGTIDLSGAIGPVGEVDLKVAAAEDAGAGVFLVPEEQAAEARSAATSLEVVPVSTFSDALEALES